MLPFTLYHILPKWVKYSRTGQPPPPKKNQLIIISPVLQYLDFSIIIKPNLNTSSLGKVSFLSTSSTNSRQTENIILYWDAMMFSPKFGNFMSLENIFDLSYLIFLYPNLIYRLVCVCFLLLCLVLQQNRYRILFFFFGL